MKPISIPITDSIISAPKNMVLKIMKQKKTIQTGIPVSANYVGEQLIMLCNFVGITNEVDGINIPYVGSLNLITEFGDNYSGEIRDSLPYNGKGRWINLDLNLCYEGEYIKGRFENGVIRKNEYQISDINYDITCDITVNNGQYWNGYLRQSWNNPIKILKITSDFVIKTELLLNAQKDSTRNREYNERNYRYTEARWLYGKRINNIQRCVLANGSFFEGEMNNGLKQIAINRYLHEPFKGKCIIKFNGGPTSSVIGHFDVTLENDQLRGKIVYDNGDIFDCLCKPGIEGKNGMEVFEEQIKNGKVSGSGVLKYRNGDIFSGSINGKTLQGNLKFLNGDVFNGTIYCDKFWNGISKFDDFNGDKYDGTWNLGVFQNGFVRIKVGNSRSFDGYIKNGVWWNGHGMYRNNNENYIGEIREGKPWIGNYHGLSDNTFFSGDLFNGKYSTGTLSVNIDDGYQFTRYYYNNIVGTKMVNDTEYKHQFQLIDNILPQELEDRKIVLYRLLSNALTIGLPLYSPKMINLVNLLNNIADGSSIHLKLPLGAAENDLAKANKRNNAKITRDDLEDSDDITTDYNIDITKKVKK